MIKGDAGQETAEQDRYPKYRLYDCRVAWRRAAIDEKRNLVCDQASVDEPEE